MTSGNGADHGRGGSSDGETSSPQQSDGKSHAVAINVILPVVFVVVVVACGSLFLFWLLRRMQRSTVRSRMRGMWAALMGREPKPQLVDVELRAANNGGDGSWTTLQVSLGLMVVEMRVLIGEH